MYIVLTLHVRTEFKTELRFFAFSQSKIYKVIILVSNMPACLPVFTGYLNS